MSTGARPPTLRQALAFLAVASAAFATSAPLARLARPVDPLAVAFARTALAALVLLLVDRGRCLGALVRMSRRQRLGIASAGALLAAHFALFLWGLELTSLPAAVSLVSLEPLSVVVCAWALFGVRPTRAEQIGVVVATLGALVIAQAAGAGEHRLGGDLLVIGAVAIYGLYVAAARGLRDAVSSLGYAALVYSGAALALGAALLVLPEARATLAAPPPRAVLALVALAAIPTLLDHTLVQIGARWFSPATVALVSPGETLGAIALAAVWLGAAPTATEAVGAIVILGGTLCAIARPRRPPEVASRAALP